MLGSNKRVLMPALAGLTAALMGFTFATAAAPYAQAGTVLAAGDLLAGESNGTVNQYGPNGALLANIPAGSAWETGACQDSSGYVYQTNFSDGTITKIASDGTVSSSSWATGLASPESCVVAPNGNVLVGQAGGDVVALNSSGSVVATYAVGGRSDWISLDSDNCTLNVAIESSPITEYNICTNSPVGSLTTNSGEAYQNEPMLNGDLLVAAGSDVEEINSSGVVRTYTIPGSSQLFGLAIAPGGNSFWAGDINTGQIWQVSFSTGNVLQTITQTGVGGLMVYSPGGSSALSYVALGDSFSSGEGDGNYLSGTNTSGDHCHRSKYAYSELLDHKQNLGTLDFVSCSGAITSDYFHANGEGNHEPAQSQALSSDTKYVTLTFGGNDVGFSEVLAQCVYGKVLFVKVHGTTNCTKSRSLTTAVSRRLKALAGKGNAKTPSGVKIYSIASILRSIHQLAPNAKIYVADYPLLFGTHFRSDCGVGTVTATHVRYIGHVKVALKLSRPDVRWLNSVGNSLASVIKSAAAANGATFVNASPDFNSHRFCDTAASWFNYVSGSYNYKTRKLNVWVGSFHPTRAGQRSGYERAFSRAGL